MTKNSSRFRLSRTALACCIGLSAFGVHAHKVDLGEVGTLEFKADAFIKAYSLDDNSVSNSPIDAHGAQSKVRLTLNMANTDGWSINTRWMGFYDWAGDRRQSGGSGSDFDSGDNVDSISLDTAYLQYDGIDSWLFRAGRQEAYWAYNFNITDDRRDRLFGARVARVAHGILVSGLTSAVLGMQLPGPGTIYLGQEMRFIAPVYIGDTITAEVEVAEILHEKNIVKLNTRSINQQGNVVISGVATIMPPKTN